MAYGFNGDKSKHYFLSDVVTKKYNMNISANSHAIYSITDIERGNYLIFICVNSNNSKKFRISITHSEINYLDFYDQCACIPLVLNDVNEFQIDIYNMNLEQSGYFQTTVTIIPF